MPGIDVTNDPLLQARLFSYLDTQLTRLGGPNFAQIPINRPHAPVNDMHRDGFHQHAVHGGRGAVPAELARRRLPVPRRRRRRRVRRRAARVAEATKVREKPASFDDHFSQARLFWLSMTPVEQEHIVLAYTFELGKCYEQAIKERQLLALANIDPDLCAQVAAGLGLPAPEPTVPLADARARARRCPRSGGDLADGRPDGRHRRRPRRRPRRGRGAARGGLSRAGMVPLVVAPHGGTLPDGIAGAAHASPRPGRSSSTRVLLAGRPGARRRTRCRRATARPGEPRAAVSTRGSSCWCRSASATPRRSAPGGRASSALADAGVAGAPGVVTGDEAGSVLAELHELMGAHRVWERFATTLG